MKKIKFISLVLFLGLNVFGQKNFSVTIAIPKDPGLTGTNYISFKISDTLLYVIENGDTNVVTPKSKVLAIYPVAQNYLKQLDSAIKEIDSFKRYVNYCIGSLSGWPRFFLFYEKNGKTRCAFIANVYRKSIFDVIDIFNSAYPNGDIISYNKKELIRKEKECKAVSKKGKT